MLPRDLGNGIRTAESTNPVVVGVDGSYVAIRAARWAAAVAVNRGGATAHCACQAVARA